jgi:CelD/BcsL family acetyltransferase involved in cellulose biosynthesis
MLNNRPRVRRFAASWVRDDSPLAPYLRAAAYEERSHEAPFIDLTKFETWDHYMQFLPMNLRRDHRKQVRRLERSGVAFAASDQQSFAKSIAWLFAQKRDWLERENMEIVQLQRRGKTYKWLSEPETEKLFAAMVKESMDSGRAWVNTLGAADGTTVAACLCFREGSILYGSKIAYDPAWHSYSPERTLMLLNIERAFREGLKKVDLMIGGQSHKKRLATDVTMVWNRRIDLGLDSKALRRPDR